MLRDAYYLSLERNTTNTIVVYVVLRLKALEASAVHMS